MTILEILSMKISDWENLEQEDKDTLKKLAESCGIDTSDSHGSKKNQKKDDDSWLPKYDEAEAIKQEAQFVSTLPDRH